MKPCLRRTLVFLCVDPGINNAICNEGRTHKTFKLDMKVNFYWKKHCAPKRLQQKTGWLKYIRHKFVKDSIYKYSFITLLEINSLKCFTFCSVLQWWQSWDVTRLIEKWLIVFSPEHLGTQWSVRTRFIWYQFSEDILRGKDRTFNSLREFVMLGT